ncbi:MAG: hypothetical protein ABI556_03010 [Gemmatimonadales bacterium]
MNRAIRTIVLAFLLAPALAAWTAAALEAQAVVPAQNLVVYRRQQALGQAAYTWAHFQDAALVQAFPSTTPITVPTGKHLVVTGIRYWFTGTNGIDLGIGPSISGVVNPPLYLARIRVTPSGPTTTLEGFEHFTNGISFPGGSKVDIKATKVVPASSDTIVWCFLYGYLEAD